MNPSNRSTMLAYLSAGLGVLSFAAFFCGAIGAIALGLPAVILGIIALTRHPQAVGEKVSALAGIILGGGAVITAIVMLGVGVFLLSFANVQ